MAEWLTEHDRIPGEAMYLGRLAVAREVSGRGFGLALLAAARELVGASGYPLLRLNCPADNDRLRRYYLDAGFADLGDADFVGPNGEQWRCSVLEVGSE
jgi:GNAT superfamily N-acetyltransferase